MITHDTLKLEKSALLTHMDHCRIKLLAFRHYKYSRNLACFMDRTDLKLGDLTFVENVASACACMGLCFQTPGCMQITYVVSNILLRPHVQVNTIFLKDESAEEQRVHPVIVSARVECCEYKRGKNNRNFHEGFSFDKTRAVTRLLCLTMHGYRLS